LAAARENAGGGTIKCHEWHFIPPARIRLSTCTNMTPGVILVLVDRLAGETRSVSMFWRQLSPKVTD
jgi:hypothetical protein